jgi:hypothetical protein
MLLELVMEWAECVILSLLSLRMMSLWTGIECIRGVSFLLLSVIVASLRMSFILSSAADGPDILSEELDMVNNMNLAVKEERYKDAGIFEQSPRFSLITFLVCKCSVTMFNDLLIKEFMRLTLRIIYV